jgi:protein ImuB
MRHGAARSLVPTLRTTTVSEARVRTAVAALTEDLRAHSPKVEPDATWAGVFLLDPSGLGRLYRDARRWSVAVHRTVNACGFVCSVVLGFDRHTTRAIAVATRTLVIARTPRDEYALAAKVSLAALALSPRALDTLGSLAIHTLGDLWTLPRESVRHRFGDEVAVLHAWSEHTHHVPVQPAVVAEPVRALLDVSPPDDDQARLLFALRGAMRALVARLAARAEAVASVDLVLHLDDRSNANHRIEPSTPTRDVTLLVELLRLRLDAASLTAPVAEAELTVHGAPLRGEQLTLLADRHTRDPNAPARAVARVCAAFGHTAVTRARLRDAHLPEAGFVWEPIAPSEMLRTPNDTSAGADVALRRLVHPPRELSPDALRALSPAPRGGDSSPWLALAAENDIAACGAPWPLASPSRVSGGWWARPVERDYYYAETLEAERLWVFFDRVRARWFVHGIVD